MTDTESAEGSVEDESVPETTPHRAPLATVRSTTRYRLLATLGGVVVGIALATQHWAGLVVGGALVGLPARTVPRAIGAGAVFGLLAVGVLLLALWTEGLAGAAIDTGLPFLAAISIGLGCGVFGSLLRGVL